MNSAIQSAIAAVERELEALDEGYAREKGELDSTLAHLQRIGAKQDGTRSPSTPRKSTKRRGRKPGPKRRGPYKKKKTAKKAERTNERTNERSKARASEDRRRL